MEELKDVFEYIKTETNRFGTALIPITASVSWNMKTHIERCTNVANGWFHSGENDGERPYKDIVTPIVNVALRSEGFDVKDIVPFVNDKDKYHLSFFVKKFHPQWARKNEIDTFIDELVESSVVYDLALVKNINNARPELVKLQQIAFCDQTDIMNGPICLKHNYTVSQILELKGKWDDEKIEEAIAMATADKDVSQANDQKAEVPSKNIEVYELRGNLPDFWLDENSDRSKTKYTNQMHIVCVAKDKDGNKKGITLFKGEDKPLSDNFKALVINRVFGRACGKSMVETLFEPQVWTNYSEIKIKELLDSAINIFQTDSDEFGNQKLSKIKPNQILKHEQGKPISKVDGSLQNLTQFRQYQIDKENEGRTLGSASDPALGKNPTAGTPFALENLIVQQGQGMHEYRQGKIATFVSDVLYRDWILAYVVKEMNSGKEFSEELTIDEMQEISDRIAKTQTKKKMEGLKASGKLTEETKQGLLEEAKKKFTEGGSRKFFKLLKGELDKIPVEVYVNINSKQKYMAQNVDKLVNIMREVIRNPQAFQQIPGISKLFNDIIESSGLNPIDFTQITTPAQQPRQEQKQTQQTNQITK